MPRIVFNEYRDQYENTNYPFMDNATLVDSSGSITIPKNIFLDAGFFFPNGFPYISNIKNVNNTITITVVSGRESASCSIGYEDIPDVLNFVTENGRFMGCIVSEKARLGWFTSLSAGDYTFYPEATAFAIRCNIPFQICGVSTMGVGEEELWGDVWLIGDKGTFVRYVGDDPDGAHVVEIDNLGEVLYKRAQCNGTYETPNYLLTINGVPADEYGNFNITIQGDTRVRLITTPDGIEIKRV